MRLSALILLLPLVAGHPPSGKGPDAILGKWEDQANTLIIEVYRYNAEYRGRIAWFDEGDLGPMKERLDIHNPDRYLRSRKVLSLEVLTHMVFNSNNHHWENGKIYDCTSGKEWSSSAWLIGNDLLNVRGFWHFELFGRNMIFRRIP